MLLQLLYKLVKTFIILVFVPNILTEKCDYSIGLVYKIGKN